ncbi:MAG: hypothetical protein ABIO22_00105 [Candidatus Saccharimonadales bacterium]
MSLDDTLNAVQDEQEAAAAPRRRVPKVKAKRSWFKNMSSAQQTPAAAPTQHAEVRPQPIKYVAESKQKGNMSKLATRSGDRSSKQLALIQPINALIELALALMVIQKGWRFGDLTLTGVPLGLAFTFIELQLFEWAINSFNDNRNKSTKLFYRVVLLGAVMVALGWYVWTRFPEAQFSVVLMFMIIIAIADPVGWVYERSSHELRDVEFQKERDEFAGWKEQQEGVIATKLASAVDILSAAGVTQDRLDLREQRLSTQNDEQIKKQVELIKEQVVDAARQILEVVKDKTAAEEARAEANRARDTYTKTHDQIREEVTTEVRKEFASEIESLHHRLSSQAHIPAPQPMFGAQPHLVVTQEGDEMGYHPGDSAER